MSRTEKILVLDGNGLIHRALHARGPMLTAPDGETITKGPFIFTRLLYKLARTRPSYFVVASDTPRDHLYRREWFPGYKAKRKDADEEVVQQIRISWEIVRELGLPVVEVPRWEADDVIATLATICPSDEVHVEIVGSDKDLHQLLSDRVSMWDPWKGEPVTMEDAEVKWGVGVDQIPLVQALMGDTSDGIPGIKDVGLKTAAKWVREYGDWQSIVVEATMGNLPERFADRVCQAQAKGDHELMLRLVTLNRELDLDVSEDDLAFDGLDQRRAAPLFRELGFSRLGAAG